MRVKTLKATGCKRGPVINAYLEAINLITGGSFTGKTRYMDATRVGLYGYHPRLGQKKTARLMAGPVLDIEAIFDGGQRNRCTWERNGKSVRHPDPLLSVTMPDVMLDFNTFLAKTGPEQTAYIVSKADPAALGYTRESITALVRGVAIGEPTEATEVALREVVAICGNTEGANTLDWMEGLRCILAARLATAKKTRAQFTGAINTAAQLKADAGERPPCRPKATIEREVAAAQTAKATAEAKRDQITKARAAHQNAVARKAMLERVVSEGTDHSAEIARLKAENAELAKVTTQNTAQALIQQMGDKAAVFNRADAQVRDLEVRANEVLAALEQLATTEACPHCGAKGKNWRANLKKTLTTQQTEIEAKLETARTNAELAEQDYDQAKERYETARDADTAANTKSGQALRRQGENNLRLYGEDGETGLEGAQRVWVAAKNELAGLQVAGPDYDEAALPQLDADIVNLGSQIATLRAELQRATTEAADQLRREQTAARQRQVEAEVLVTGLALDVIDEQREKLVAKCMESLMDLARRFTDNILDGHLDFKEGELGMWIDNAWVSHDTFSDTEKAIAYAGMSVALAQQAPIKLVLIDELGVIDDRHALLLLERMKALAADGTIDQFVGIDRDMRRYADTPALEGVNVINVKTS